MSGGFFTCRGVMSCLGRHVASLCDSTVVMLLVLYYCSLRGEGLLMWMKRMGKGLGALALLALLVRAVLPAGYMFAAVDTAGGRYVTLQVCDGQAGPHTLLNLDTGEEISADALPKKPLSPGSPCVFSMAVGLAGPRAVFEPVVFRPETAVVFAEQTGVRPGRGMPAPPPPATGPPSLI